MTESLQEIIDLLEKHHHLLRNGHSIKEEVALTGKSSLLWRHELALATYALNAHLAGIESPLLHFSQNEKGAIPLFKSGYFPWGALPYPKEHARLGKVLALLGKATGNDHYLAQAKKLADWQRQTLDHKGLPILSLFLQEGGALHELQEANAALFAECGEEKELKGAFSDPDFALAGFKTEDSTILSLGFFSFGCKLKR